MNTEPPVDGSVRDQNVQLVYRYIKARTWGAGYPQLFTNIATGVGLTRDEVKQAIYDLRDHYHNHGLILSVPGEWSDWGVEVGWRKSAMLGLANQMLHLATREKSEATLLERAARVETDPVVAHVYRTKAADARAASIQDYGFAASIKAKAAKM